MRDIVELTSYILLGAVVLLLTLILCLNVYLKIRRQFPIKVNCWFCNEWTKMPYNSQNCFECPTCLQYNGFNSDGSYNRLIPAQQDELLNRQIAANKSNGTLLKNSNGLCHICNNNQRLKVYQLANYVPFNEANFDAEIEHFEKQLEKAYTLCPNCDSVLKQTINKQNFTLGLNFSELRKKGLLLMDLDCSHNGVSKETKQAFIRKMLQFLLIVLAILNLSLTLGQLDFSNRSLKKHIPKSLFNYTVAAKGIWTKTYEELFLQIDNNLITFKQCFGEALLQVPYMTDMISLLSVEVYDRLPQSAVIMPYLLIFKNAFVVCLLGTILQLLSTVLWKEKNNLKRLIYWGLVLFVHYTYPKKYGVLPNLVQIVGSISIVASICLYQQSAEVKLKKLKQDHPSKAGDQKKVPILQSTPLAGYSCKNNSPKRAFNNLIPTSRNSLRNAHNYSFQTNTASCSNNSFYSYNSSNDVPLYDDLELSLNKLHLGNTNSKKLNLNLNIDRPKPLISPSKFKNATQNSWVAGGFWKNTDNNYFSPGQFSNVSRSSSQTSGFVSQTAPSEHTNYFSLPPSANNSYAAEFETGSCFSEPSYYLHPQNRNYGHYFARLPSYTDFRHCRPFYPLMNQEQVVYCAPNYMQSYNLQRGLFNTDRMNFNSNISFGSLNPDKNHPLTY